MTTTTTTRPTRVRAHGTAVLDGDHLRARPPADVLPESLRPLAAERDDLYRRLNEARAELRDLEGRWTTAESDAARADRRAASEAARAGKTVRNPSANVDALRERRQRLRDQVAAATAGLADACSEASDARAAEAENPAHRARVAEAAERVHTAADALERALREAAQALAVCEWLEEGQPYSPATVVDLESLAAGAVTGGAGGHRGVDALAAARALARWAD